MKYIITTTAAVVMALTATMSTAGGAKMCKTVTVKQCVTVKK